MMIDFENFYDFINVKFWDFFESKDRIRLSFGGAGSGKSYSEFQRVAHNVCVEQGHNYVIARKVANTNKTSTYALMKQIFAELKVTHMFKENKSDMTFTCKHNGNMIVFKGLDDIEKLKSITFPSGVLTDILIEEASEISQGDFDQLNMRLRGKAKVPFQITMLLNPISDKHWIKIEFFDKRSYQKKFKVCILKSTYLDNEFLDDDYKSILEGYKDIDHEMYRVYCLGEWGHFGNVIFSNWTLGKCPYREEDFDSVFCGMDFGFNHPSVISKVGFKDGVMYSFDELCIQEKTNIEFIAENEEYGIMDKRQQCRADSAEPDRVKEWQQKGYSVIGADKGPGSVRRGIDFIKSQRWVIDPDRCPRLHQEVQVYHWKTDKHKQVVQPEEPVDLMDDAIKALMYALEPLSKSKGKPGVLSGTIPEAKKEIIEIRRAQRKQMKEVLKIQRARKREMIENKKI